MLKKVYAFILVLNGFKYANAKKYVNFRKKGNLKKNRQLKSICRALPFEEKLGKLFSDVLSVKMALPEINELFPEYMALKVTHNGEKRYISLTAKPSSSVYIKLDDLIGENQNLIIRPCENIFDSNVHRVQTLDGHYYFDNEEVSYSKLRNIFEHMPDQTIVIKDIVYNSDIMSEFKFEHPLYRVMVLGEVGAAPKIIRAYITEFNTTNKVYVDFHEDRFKEAKEIINHIFSNYSEIQYMNIAFAITADCKFKVMQIDVGEDLIYFSEIPEEVERFIHKKNIQKSNRFPNKLQIIKKYAFSVYAGKKGFVNFMYSNWLRGLKDDKRFGRTTKKEKRWAHRHGFYSYRIKQYGITKGNYGEFLSDYDYKSLRPLNNGFYKWFWDKKISYHILKGCNDVLPIYYCHSVAKGNEIVFIPFEKEVGEIYDYKRLIDILKTTSILAVKPEIGSHGNGFFKVQYKKSSEEFFINESKNSEQEIEDFFKSLPENYLISEYIEAHKILKTFYPTVTPTIRIMTIRDGTSRLIKDAYLRIGTAKTGNTDNISAGGIEAAIDIETGRIKSPELLENHVFVPCAVHPDSGEEIKGIVPYWEKVKKIVRGVADYVAPLEYLGFDIVVTETGVKILEINTHQDLHKYSRYPDDVKKYFMDKLKEKNEL